MRLSRFDKLFWSNVLVSAISISFIQDPWLRVSLFINLLVYVILIEAKGDKG